jgi:hypothetical protein
MITRLHIQFICCGYCNLLSGARGRRVSILIQQKSKAFNETTDEFKWICAGDI